MLQPLSTWCVRKLGFVFLWDVLHNLLLFFFPIQITKTSQKSKLPLLKKGGGDFTVKFSFIARANLNGLSGYNGWSIQMS